MGNPELAVKKLALEGIAVQYRDRKGQGLLYLEKVCMQKKKKKQAKKQH